MARKKVLSTVAVIGKMDVAHLPGVVQEVEIVEKIGLGRAHVGGVEGKEKIVFPEKIVSSSRFARGCWD